jgi:hypothetical protein
MTPKTTWHAATTTVSAMTLALAVSNVPARAQRAQPPATPAPQAAPQARAPVDLTGYWVSVVTEDWRWRMVTPRKGDYAALPLNPEGRRVADTWDRDKDVAAGNQCRPFGVGGLMRMPGRLHITWQDPNTLKIDADAGTQTRLLHFDNQPTPAEKTWQGTSVAQWEVTEALLADARQRGRAGAGPTAPIEPRPGGGSLKARTTNMRPGYVRKNGVPYSENMVLTEYFDVTGEPNGDRWLVVMSMVDDPLYFNQTFITTTHFKKEPNGSKWHPTPCETDAPAAPVRR